MQPRLTGNPEHAFSAPMNEYRSLTDGILRVFIGHYNTHRPYRSLDLRPPDPHAQKLQVVDRTTAIVERRDRLGGLIHEFSLAAYRGC